MNFLEPTFLVVILKLFFFFTLKAHVVLTGLYKWVRCCLFVFLHVLTCCLQRRWLFFLWGKTGLCLLACDLSLNYYYYHFWGSKSSSQWATLVYLFYTLYSSLWNMFFVMWTSCAGNIYLFMHSFIFFVDGQVPRACDTGLPGRRAWERNQSGGLHWESIRLPIRNRLFFLF